MLNSRKRIILTGVAAICFNFGSPAMASATIGATFPQQIAQMAVDVAAYAEATQSYVVQMQQYETQMRNLAANPFSVFGAEAAMTMRKIGGLMDAGKSIGGSMAQIDRRLSQKYDNPTAHTFSENFKAWGDSSQETLNAAMKSAGLRRDQFTSSADALEALYTKAKNADGAKQAAGVAAEIAIDQTKQLHALGDLLANQQIAQGDYMKQQMAKEQAIQDSQTVRFKATELPSESSYKNPKF